MDYEKKYNEALERAKEMCATPTDKTTMEYIFPELCESEDERIRKQCIELLRGAYSTEYEALECIAWLKKQKEQKPEIAKSEIEFADKYSRKVYEELVSNFKSIDGYFIGCNDVSDIVLNAILDAFKWQKPAEWSEKHIADIFEKVGLAKIVREQGNDELTNAVQSAMIELSKGNSKEWSEEDEKRIKQLIYDTEAIRADYEKKKEQLGDRFNNELIKDCDEQINWLKSLRPQPDKCNGCSKHLEGYINGRSDAENKLLEDYGAVITPEHELHMKPRWKPSEEQMEALLWCIAHLGGADRRVLAELYEHLKMNCK